MGRSYYAGVLVAALRRPALLLALLRHAWVFRGREWYRHPPFLPIPPAPYMAWRMYTAYGDAEATPPLDELERYLHWAAKLRVKTGRNGRGGPE